MANKQNKKPISNQAQTRSPQAKPAAKKADAQKKGLSATLKLALLLGIISFAIYANTLSNGYALDDFNTIKDNTIVTQGSSAIGEIFSTPYRRGWFVSSNDLYRPLSLVMFAIEWQAGDGSPAPGHFMNVLLFAVCVMLLFLFLDSFFEKKKPAVAFIASLLFALHPIHTEVVANIKSRDEILCFFFAFLAMNVFLKYAGTGKMKHLILAAGCFLLSLMSKETVITFLAVIPLVFYFYRNENKQRSTYITITAFVTAGVFLLIRFSVLSAYNANHSSDVSFIDNMLSGAPSAASRLATEFAILGNYIKLLIAPYPLVCDYSFNSIPFTGFGNPWVLLSMAVYIVLGVWGIYGLAKLKKDPFVFSALFYLSAITLFSNIPFLIGTPMAERFLFFPSVAFCLAIALAVEKWLLKTPEARISAISSSKVLAVIVPLAILYAGMTFSRNTDWMDNLSLFKADVNKSPNDSRLAYYYGTELISRVQNEGNPQVKQPKVAEGITYLRRSLDIYPDYENALSELGNAYFHANQNDSAEKYDKMALNLNPKSALTLNNLAGVYFVTQRYPLALEICKRSIDLNPKYVDAYANEGLCFLHMRMADSSLFYLYKAISINPKFKTSYFNMALTYKGLGKLDSVRKYEALAKSK